MASMDSPVHMGLREEIKTLKKRMIELETVEADKEKLRKELSNVKKQMSEEKARMELEFMNQVSAISQANALKVEEIEGQLRESNTVNRALNEQLEKVSSVEKKMQDMEMHQEKEIARIVDKKLTEIEGMRQELDIVKHSKDELAVKLGEAQKRIETERKKVQELNTSLEELNASILNDSQAEKENVDALLARLFNSEIENDKLKNELKIASEKEQKCSIEQAEAVHTLREKLRARDLELNTKIEEMRRVELILKDNMSQSASTVELENANFRLGNDLKNAIATRNERDLVISGLENENGRLKSYVTTLQQENKNLVTSLQDSMKHASLNKMAESNDAFVKLQSEYRELKQSHTKLETEIDDLKATLRQESNRRLSSEGSVLQRENSSGVGNRASMIIQQLEENLKRESQSKQATTLAMKQKQAAEKTNDMKVQSLAAELDLVKVQLNSERDIVKKLRKELRDVKDQRVLTQRSSSTYSGTVRGDVEAIDTRTAVKGIVRNIEQRLGTDESKQKVSKPIGGQLERAEEFPAVKADLQEPQEELSHERQQLAELEDELTRQCEINCALLKEISNLSCENEAFRELSLQTCGTVNSGRYGDDQKEFDRLIMEVASVKSQLFNAEQSKVNLEERYNDLMAKHKKEVEAFKRQLELAEKATRSISSRMDESFTLDKQEIESLQRRLKETKDELWKSKDILASHQKKSSQQILNLEQSKVNLEERYNALTEKHKKEIEAFKKQLELAEKATRSISSRMDESSILDKQEIESLQRKLKEAKNEISKSKDLLTSHQKKASLQAEIQSAKMEALQAEFVNAERYRVEEHQSEFGAKKHGTTGAIRLTSTDRQ
jgi:chromosome segregation ATPase